MALRPSTVLGAFRSGVIAFAAAISLAAATGDSYAVDYTIANQWNNGFQANIKITNKAAVAIKGWTLTWAYANGQQVSSAWNATVTQSGVNVTASNPASSWNGTIAANGGSVSFGFQGTYAGTNPIPSVFVLNGADPGLDKQAPTVPMNLASPSQTTTTLNLMWTASTDNVGVTGYDIYRGTTLVGSSTTPLFSDTGLTADTAYSYTVRAKDAAGNLSATSAALTVRTRAGGGGGGSYVVDYTIANQWSNGFQANIKITNNGAAAIKGWTLTWTYANGQRVTSAWNATVTQSGANVTANSPASSWNGTIAANGGSVSFGFQGTYAGTNPIPSVFVLNGLDPGPDKQAPTVPTNLASPSQTTTSINLTWTASTDNIAVTGYDIYRGTTLAGSSTTASFGDTGLTAETPYSYTVRAKDAAGNVSATSATLTVRTLPAPSIPTVPTGLAGVPASSSVTLTWNASATATGYDVYRNSTLIASPTATSYIDSGLSSSTNYTYAVRAKNVAGNSAQSAPISVLTLVAGAGRFRVDAKGNITVNGAIFHVRGGSWFGLQGRYEIATDPVNPRGAPMEQYMGNVFWAPSGRTYDQDIAELKAMGINLVRLPLVHQTLDATDPQGTLYLKNDQSVRIVNSRLALETIIKKLDAAGIYVLLDLHSCSNYVDWRKGRLDARPPYVDATRDNYDFKREDCSCSATDNPSSVTRIQAYNETVWLQDMRTLANFQTTLGVTNILGIDIYNEPWDYSWAEWKTLTEHAYTAINEVNSDTLIFMQGISATAGNQDGTPTTITQSPHGSSGIDPNWGENLFEAGTTPPAIPRDRLVFSPHAYGPSVAVGKQFVDPAQPQFAGLEGDAVGDAKANIVIRPAYLEQGWEEHFGYLKAMGYAIVIGEFGGNMDWPLGAASLRDQKRYAYLTDKTVDAQWQTAFVNYLLKKGITDTIYWSINPESGDTGGLYTTPYRAGSNESAWGTWGVLDTRKMNLLKPLWGN